MKRDKRLGIAIGIAILVLSIAASQTVSAQLTSAIVKGYVFDTEGNAIEGVLIEWRNSETGELFENTTTTLVGYYSTQHLFDGTVKSSITASKTDYSTNETVITTTAAFPPAIYEENFTLLEVATTGDVNINEIMYNPSSEQGYDRDMEWLELYNNDVVAINLSGWTIETPGVGTITEDITMQPESYVVLARNKNAFEKYYGVLSCPITEVLMKLSNTGDTIVLKDSFGTEIDNVTYIDDWGADGNGKTLELTGIGGSWLESLVYDGTPCAENSVVFMKPDLTVTDISPNCGYLFGNESNEVCAKVENIGVAAAGAFNVSFHIDGFSGEERISGLAAGANTTLCVTDSTIRNAGIFVSINVTADCNHEVKELNETNNWMNISKMVMNNGYKGKRYMGGEDIKTVQIDILNGNILYSVGDSYYLSGSSTPWDTYTANWTASDLPVPADATIEKARLYVMYTWDKVNGMPDNVSLTLNGNLKTIDAFYTDRKGYGKYDYPYGMLAYTVADDFNAGSINTAVLENLNPVAGNPSIRGMVLVVVYAGESEPKREIFMNEGFDLLYGGSSKCTTPEEATAYAPITGTIDTADKTATLITFAPGAGPNEGELIFNGQTWTDVWHFAGSSQIGIDEREVTPYLQATGNEAGFQSSADYMEASNAILVVEYKAGININEIMYNPSSEQGSDPDMEWLELYNHDTIAINLSGWTIETPEVGTITEDITMQPGSYVVLARNKNAFEKYYGVLSCPITEVLMKLSNTGDTIVLKDSAGTEIDNVTYIDDWGADGNGKTLELNATGWFESEVEGGTPCERNSITHEKPDLIVTDIIPNCDYLFANESNEVCAKIENIGVAAAGAFNVSFHIDGFSREDRISGLAAGANTTLCVTDPTTVRNAGILVSINVTADCNHEVNELNETNNWMNISTTVVNNGYKGKTYTGGENITTWKTFELNGNLLYSLGDSYYLGGYSGWPTASYTANWSASNLSVPVGATIREARLYVPYCFDYQGDMPDNVSLKFNENAQILEKHYTDRKSHGSWDYPYGMLAYNVTDDFDTSGNIANLTNSNPKCGEQKTVSIRGMLLVVIYADDSELRRTIYVNEEFDLLYGGSGKCTTPEEATAYAPITGTIDTTDKTATLITFAPGAGPDEGELIFNGQTWTDVWNFAGSSQIGIDERDVTSYLQATGNEAGFQSSADYMEASNAILVVEVATPRVSISTDKTIYNPGDTMIVTLNLTNPMDTDQDVLFAWYIGTPASDDLICITSMPLTLSAGCDYSIPIQISVGNWGPTGFDAVWLVNLSDPITHDIISEDTAEWSYAPPPSAVSVGVREGEITAANIAAEEIGKEINKAFKEEVVHNLPF